MKTTELMRAMEEARPDLLEAAAPDVRANDPKPDVSGVLGKIRGGQADSAVRVPVVSVQQTRRPRLVTAVLTACSIAACAAVVTGLAFLIRNTGETIETSSEIAVQFASETAPVSEAPAAEPFTGLTTGTTAGKDSASVVNLPFVDTQPVSQTVNTTKYTTAQTNHREPVLLENTSNTEPPQAPTEKPVTRDAVNRRTPVDFRIPENYSGTYHFEIVSDIIRLSGHSFMPEKEGGVVAVTLSRTGLGDDLFELRLVNEATGKKTSIGTYRMNRDSIVTPVNADMDKAFREVFDAAATTPAQTTPEKPVTKDALSRSTPVEFRIPEDAVGTYHFEIESKTISIKKHSFAPEKQDGTVTVTLSRTGLSDDTFELTLVNEETGKKAKVGTYRMDRNNIVTPVDADMDKAFLEVCTDISTAISWETKNLPATSFVCKWNSDQYITLDTALHHESAAAWKNQRMSDGDRALYIDGNDGFRWLDENVDSAHYLWFMYEADGYVPEVRSMELTDNLGSKTIQIHAVLVPSDVQGKVRVMIPLNAETPASWFEDATEQWQLIMPAEKGYTTEKPIAVNWYWIVD